MDQKNVQLWMALGVALLTKVGGTLPVTGLALSMDFLSLRAWVAYHAPFLARPVTRAREPLSKPTAQALEEGVSLLGLGLMMVGLIIAMVLLARLRPTRVWVRTARGVAVVLLASVLCVLLLVASASPFIDLPPELIGLADRLRRGLARLIQLLV